MPALIFHIIPRQRPRAMTKFFNGQEHPEVVPQVSHLRQVPLRTIVNKPHSRQGSPSYPLSFAWRAFSAMEGPLGGIKPIVGAAPALGDRDVWALGWRGDEISSGPAF
jgi:hypothetical protein